MYQLVYDPNLLIVNSNPANFVRILSHIVMSYIKLLPLLLCKQNIFTITLPKIQK